MEFEMSNVYCDCDNCYEECAGTEYEPCHFWTKKEKKQWYKNKKL